MVDHHLVTWALALFAVRAALWEDFRSVTVDWAVSGALLAMALHSSLEAGVVVAGLAFAAWRRGARELRALTVSLFLVSVALCLCFERFGLRGGVVAYDLRFVALLAGPVLAAWSSRFVFVLVGLVWVCSAVAVGGWWGWWSVEAAPGKHWLSEIARRWQAVTVALQGLAAVGVVGLVAPRAWTAAAAAAFVVLLLAGGQQLYPNSDFVRWHRYWERQAVAVGAERREDCGGAWATWPQTHAATLAWASGCRVHGAEWRLAPDPVWPLFELNAAEGLRQMRASGVSAVWVVPGHRCPPTFECPFGSLSRLLLGLPRGGLWPMAELKAEMQRGDGAANGLPSSALTGGPARSGGQPARR